MLCERKKITYTYFTKLIAFSKSSELRERRREKYLPNSVFFYFSGRGFFQHLLYSYLFVISEVTSAVYYLKYNIFFLFILYKLLFPISLFNILVIYLYSYSNHKSFSRRSPTPAIRVNSRKSVQTKMIVQVRIYKARFPPLLNRKRIQTKTRRIKKKNARLDERKKSRVFLSSVQATENGKGFLRRKFHLSGSKTSKFIGKQIRVRGTARRRRRENAIGIRLVHRRS